MGSETDKKTSQSVGQCRTIVGSVITVQKFDFISETFNLLITIPVK